MVNCTVSTIHPSIFFLVVQNASPFRSFFTEFGSFRRASSLSFFRKTRSMHAKMCLLACCLMVAFPWARQQKSSQYTSTYCRNRPAVVAGRSLHSAATSASRSSDGMPGLLSLSVGGESASASRGWGGAVAAAAQSPLTRSATVSVVAQKYWADSTYPMGRDRWKPISGSASVVWGGTTKANFGTSSGRIQTRIYASLISTLDKKTGPNAGSAVTMLCSSRLKAPPNWTASGGASLRTASLSPPNVKS
jgi:hypothetical protein